MMNANNFASGRVPYGQALFTVSTPVRTFSTYKTIKLPECCIKKQEAGFFAPEYMMTGFRPMSYCTKVFPPIKSNSANCFFANKTSKPNEQIVLKVCTTSNTMTKQENDSLMKKNHEPTMVCQSSTIESQSQKYTNNQQEQKQNCCKKKKNMKKKKSKKNGGNKKPCKQMSVKEVPNKKRLSECSDSSFTIEFQDSDSEDCILENTPTVSKKVHFADDNHLCKVHVMNRWDFAYRAARKGPWEEMARDRDRFYKRIRNAETQLKNVLSPLHREKIYNARFANMDT